MRPAGASASNNKMLVEIRDDGKQRNSIWQFGKTNTHLAVNRNMR